MFIILVCSIAWQKYCYIPYSVKVTLRKKRNPCYCRYSTFSNLFQLAQCLVLSDKPTTGEQLQQNWDKLISHILYFMWTQQENVLVKAFLYCQSSLVILTYTNTHPHYDIWRLCSKIHFNWDWCVYICTPEACICDTESILSQLLTFHMWWLEEWSALLLPWNSWMTNLTGSPFVGV